MKKNIVVASVVLLLLVVLGAYAAQRAQTAPGAMPHEPAVGETAPDFTLESLAGKKVTLSAVAKKKRIVLIVLRGYPGYQCPFCTRQVADLVSHADDFAKANATVLLVYPGAADVVKQRAGEFAPKDMPSNFVLLTDPDFGFVNKYALRWDRAGETAYPSTFILDSNRKIVFAKISHAHGGRATAQEIQAALAKMPAKSDSKRLSDRSVPAATSRG